MKYWLLISSRENWPIIQKMNLFGVSKKKMFNISKAQIGDKCLVYLKQDSIEKTILPPIVTGIYEINSKVFEDNTIIFKSPAFSLDERFPLRVKIKPIKIFDNPIEFKPLIPKLHFITNKQNWPAHLQGYPLREIPEIDFDLIVNSLKNG